MKLQNEKTKILKKKLELEIRVSNQNLKIKELELKILNLIGNKEEKDVFTFKKKKTNSCTSLSSQVQTNQEIGESTTKLLASIPSPDFEKTQRQGRY